MSTMIDLSGRTALVTGASGGIGTAIVDLLVQAGAEVVGADLDPSALAGRAGVTPLGLDITDEDAVEAALGDRAIDIVVNNAGVAGRVGMPFTRLGKADWAVAWDVNVVGPFLVTKAVTDSLIARRGCVVNIASVSGRTGFQTSPPYSASKAAIINFTQCMARDLAPHGVRVNAVCPGMVFTPFYQAQRLAAAERDPALLEVTDEDYFADKAQRLIPLGRGQEPADIAAAVLFLASPLAASITGQSLNVDGGLVMS